MALYNQRQSGFSAVEVILVLAIIAVVALVGYNVHNRSSNKTPVSSGTSNSQSTGTSTVSTAPAINSSSDLDKALTTLDQNDPSTANSSDSGQLDTQLSSF